MLLRLLKKISRYVSLSKVSVRRDWERSFQHLLLVENSAWMLCTKTLEVLVHSIGRSSRGPSVLEASDKFNRPLGPLLANFDTFMMVKDFNQASGPLPKTLRNFDKEGGRLRTKFVIPTDCLHTFTVRRTYKLGIPAHFRRPWGCLNVRVAKEVRIGYQDENVNGFFR